MLDHVRLCSLDRAYMLLVMNMAMYPFLNDRLIHVLF